MNSAEEFDGGVLSRTQRGFREGIALVVVLTVLAVLSTIAFYLHMFSTRQRFQSHRLSSGEIALQAAQFTARQVCLLIGRSIDFINSSSPSTFPKRSSSAPPSLREFLLLFVSPEGRLKWENLKFKLSNEPFDLINRAVIPDYSPSLELNILVSYEKLENPLLASFPISGLQAGLEDEHSGRFIVDVTATFSGVSRRILAVINERSMNLTWPVLGRFVLYAGQIRPQPLDEGVNRVTYKLEGTSLPRLVETFDLDPNLVRPLVVRGGEYVSPERRAVLAADPDAAARFLDGQGWILLGGPEITLGLAPGTKEYGEHFLLAGDSIFLRDIVRDTNPFGFEAPHPDPVRFPSFRFRLWESHEIYSILTGLYRESRSNARSVFLSQVRDCDPTKSSVLRLMGTHEHQSPTLVFGNVFRRYILEQGLRVKTSSGATPTPDSIAAVCPFIPRESFPQAQWMPGFDAEVTGVIKATCGNDWEGGYRGAMSIPIKTAFNEGLAFWLSQPKEPGVAEDRRTILGGFVTGKISKLGRSFGFTPPHSSEKLVLGLDEDVSLYRASRKVFSGKLQEVLPCVRNLALSRCGRGFKTGPALQDFLRKTLEAGGSTVGFYHVEKPFEWTDSWNQLALGGCGIVCDGPITISAGVKPAGGDRFPDAAKNQITFVALSGDVTVNTDQPVEASLLAPAGKLVVSGGCRIAGLVAVNTIDLSVLSNSQEKTICYDPIHDWTDETAFQNGYRVMLEQNPVIFSAKLD